LNRNFIKRQKEARKKEESGVVRQHCQMMKQGRHVRAVSRRCCFMEKKSEKIATEKIRMDRLDLTIICYLANDE